VANTAGTTYTDTNLLNGSTYYYIVIAYDSGGPSIDSPAASATPFSTNLPAINGFTFSRNQLNLSGAGGTPNAYFSVLASTNLLLPVNDWVRLQTNQFDSNGDFSCTNLPGAVGYQNFYRLQVQ